MATRQAGRKSIVPYSRGQKLIMGNKTYQVLFVLSAQFHRHQPTDVIYLVRDQDGRDTRVDHMTLQNFHELGKALEC